MSLPQLPWTGERMVPHASDLATELYHWQRYLFFRPWYEHAKVVDAASGEGYGSNYASVFAQSVVGVDLCAQSVAHGSERYPEVKFVRGDVCEFDYSSADLVISFETIEHLPDPEAFLGALRSCSGRIVISTPNRKTHSPGNEISDKPLNQFHTVEWTPLEFAELIQKHFGDRSVRFLSQQMEWPGRIVEGLDDDAMYCIAVIGDGELPVWPTIGLAMPTVDNPGMANDTILNLSRFYPGQLKFAVTLNGSNESTKQKLRDLSKAMPSMVQLIESETNLGYGQGANRALHVLLNENLDFYGVINDDVVPAVDCLNEMVNAMLQLRSQGLNPGMIGPVSNNVNGLQQVDIGAFNDIRSMHFRAETWHRQHHNSADQAIQVRGLFLLMTPECLDAIGGFDPIFGIGNFEDDDLNLRCRLAGYSLWIARGAFLFHHGSKTFTDLKVDYSANIQRNLPGSGAFSRVTNGSLLT
ncbi:MAG TPA: methyltransferase domain-containing protein [Fimbriimonadaceae bacterium]|nr:methyltransferase domain-containing protein [Fimbriimonadaceae bacterium]